MKTGFIGLVVILVTGCGADAGVPSVSATVGGVEITCRSETRLPTSTACGDWGRELLRMEPAATRAVITLHRGTDGPCEVDFFGGDHVIRSVPDLPCIGP